jgi:microcystin-dependent protein
MSCNPGDCDTPFVGEIIAVAFSFAPQGWAMCDGALLPIEENQTLFNLIGTTYGGDGQTTFALPDLRGRGPVNQGSGPGLTSRTLAEEGGAETVTLVQGQLPQHGHGLAAATSFTSSSPTNASPAPGEAYGSPGSLAMESDMIQPVGSGGAHENMPPFLTVNWCISLFGIFPPRN